ncbi:DUF2249 domain-containing protein [Natrinema salsiterrestre]|uniref:DUF2249 domain-containing protein n=1 Tax=Natrinema salsiterrestre TaxID=2950540 RepID=A0A9Q4LAC1_9EURY|nr:DUF2249 domain-containing protein [Natrinema salsiterrestre]MDF9748286.1 DUF2249 domain-containing protein [Natrinema salsiterrestre]
MTTSIDLRNLREEEQRDHLFDGLDELEDGSSISITADRDITAFLYSYQIKRGVVLEREDDPTDSDDSATRVTKVRDLDEDERASFDVRSMPPQKRHRVLLETFDDLEPGEGFVFLNDHDPKPLSHEIRSTRGETFDWEYRSRESREWAVEVVKTDASEGATDGVFTKFDVRKIPKQERHPTIHHRYGMLPDGATMEIVAPHEPRPLRQEFTQRYGGSFSWDVAESEPGRCRVQITKGEESTDTDAAGEMESSSAPDESDSITVTEELDVRDRPPAERHELIFEAYADLEGEQAFVLVNDHDPKPLYHQFEAEAGPEFQWEYQKKEPGEFRVLIGKSENRTREPDANESVNSPF